ncbi:MAG: hypothetical protein WBM44_25475 [Waterburya sp.]
MLFEFRIPTRREANPLGLQAGEYVNHLIEEAGNECLENFTTSPTVSPRLEAKIEEVIALYCQSENG